MGAARSKEQIRADDKAKAERQVREMFPELYKKKKNNKKIIGIKKVAPLKLNGNKTKKNKG